MTPEERLAHNLARAREAVQYVNGLEIVANNRLSDRLQAAGSVEQIMSEGKRTGHWQGMRTVQTAEGPRLRGYPGPSGVGVRTVRVEWSHIFREGYPVSIAELEGCASAATSARGGNCGEQAAIAFMYLYKRGIRPLHYMKFSAEGYDHMWVVVGMAAGGQPEELRSWGPEAVWCDPWQRGGVAFVVDDFVKGKVRNLNAIYKCDTAERVQAGNPRLYFVAR